MLATAHRPQGTLVLVAIHIAWQCFCSLHACVSCPPTCLFTWFTCSPVPFRSPRSRRAKTRGRAARSLPSYALAMPLPLPRRQADCACVRLLGRMRSHVRVQVHSHLLVSYEYEYMYEYNVHVTELYTSTVMYIGTLFCTPLFSPPASPTSNTVQQGCP